MTIARNRWQEHLKSRGNYYKERAREMAELHRSEANVGAGTASLALGALAVFLERCRVQRLTRNQHVLFKLGSLVAHAEIAMMFSKRAAASEYGESVVFDRETWQAMARIFSRESALKVVLDGIHLVMGGGAGDSRELAETGNLVAIMDAQSGMIRDMDLVSEKLNQVFKAK